MSNVKIQMPKECQMPKYQNILHLKFELDLNFEL